jgi:hypothetical protein
MKEIGFSPSYVKKINIGKSKPQYTKVLNLNCSCMIKGFWNLGYSNINPQTMIGN